MSVCSFGVFIRESIIGFFSFSLKKKIVEKDLVGLVWVRVYFFLINEL